MYKSFSICNLQTWKPEYYLPLPQNSVSSRCLNSEIQVQASPQRALWPSNIPYLKATFYWTGIMKFGPSTPCSVQESSLWSIHSFQVAFRGYFSTKNSWKCWVFSQHWDHIWDQAMVGLPFSSRQVGLIEGQKVYSNHFLLLRVGKLQGTLTKATLWIAQCTVEIQNTAQRVATYYTLLCWSRTRNVQNHHLQ
jgi:hypothetical protein